MALMRSAAMSALTPLLEGERTKLGHPETGENDPTATSAAPGEPAAEADSAPIKVLG
jgi:hypothetical protein